MVTPQEHMHEPGDPARQRLSALMDGELDPADWGATCDALRGDSRLRADWHDWHLIGDALRSTELAAPSGRDSAFLQGVRARLAAEPVVLAPVAAAPQAVAVQMANGRRRLHWAVAPAAMAAGFVAVAGVMLVLRSGPGTEAPSGPVLASGSTPADPGVQRASLEMMRDAQLDRYLATHRRMSGGANPTNPGLRAQPVEALVVVPK